MKKLKPNKEHIEKVLGLLHSEVISASGDGDALWYTIYYDIEDIKKLVEEYNDDYAIGWEIKTWGKFLTWGIDQECVLITDDLEAFNSQPDYIQMKIQY